MSVSWQRCEACSRTERCARCSTFRTPCQREQLSGAIQSSPSSACSCLPVGHSPETPANVETTLVRQVLVCCRRHVAPDADQVTMQCDCAT